MNVQNPIEEKEALRHGAFAFSPDFPEIRTVSDIKPYVRPDVGLRIYEWADDYLGANYAIAGPETFLGSIDLEWRGLVFDRASGDLISRPLHKFFNLLERQALDEIDLSVPSWIEDKLDGSMIAAFLDPKEEVIFHTRGGFSSQASAARADADPEVLDLVRHIYAEGWTPIFEWTSPKNRIVIKYDDARLTLLAIRHRLTGEYMPGAKLEEVAQKFGVRVRVNHGAGPSDVDGLKKLMNAVRAMEGEEGRVLVFENGHRIKLKSDQYRLYHKVGSELHFEKNAYRAWVDNAIDDVAVMLGDERGVKLREFGAAIDRATMVRVDEIEALLAETADFDSKERAARFREALPKQLQGAAFAMAKGQDGMDQMRRIVAWGFGSQSKMDDVHKVFDLPTWSLPGGGLDETGQAN